MLNIPSMHGGSNLWGEAKKSDRANQELPEVIVDPEDLKVSPQGKTSSRTGLYPSVFKHSPLPKTVMILGNLAHAALDSADCLHAR